MAQNIFFQGIMPATTHPTMGHAPLLIIRAKVQRRDAMPPLHINKFSDSFVLNR
jgi:hypothetical protein